MTKLLLALLLLATLLAPPAQAQPHTVHYSVTSFGEGALTLIQYWTGGDEIYESRFPPWSRDVKNQGRLSVYAQTVDYAQPRYMCSIAINGTTVVSRTSTGSVLCTVGF